MAGGSGSAVLPVLAHLRVHSPYDPPAEFDRFSDPDYDGPVRVGPEAAVEECGPEDHRGCQWKGAPYFAKLMDRLDERDLQFVREKYAGEVLEVDQLVAQLWAELQRLGLERNTIVVLTSDHGESFGDRKLNKKIGHGILYDEVLRVPLIIRAPGIERQTRVADTVASVDIVPTLLTMLELPLPESLEGRSLVHGVQDRPLFAELPRSADDYQGAVYFSGFKLVWSRNGSGERRELYDLGQDPGELRNLAGAEHPLEERLLTLLLARVGSGFDPLAEEFELDDDLRAELEGLGYH